MDWENLYAWINRETAADMDIDGLNAGSFNNRHFTWKVCFSTLFYLFIMFYFFAFYIHLNSWFMEKSKYNWYLNKFCCIWCICTRGHLINVYWLCVLLSFTLLLYWCYIEDTLGYLHKWGILIMFLCSVFC